MPTTSPIDAQEVAESHSDNATIFTPPEASFLQINICEFYDYWNKDNSNSIFLALQQNLWVNLGSGKSPSV